MDSIDVSIFRHLSNLAKLDLFGNPFKEINGKIMNSENSIKETYKNLLVVLNPNLKQIDDTYTIKKSWAVFKKKL